MPHTNDALHLDLVDGRRLGYARYGQLDRPAYHVFFFHGAKFCRLEGEVLDEPARRLGVEIISIDRPGVGLSTEHLESLSPASLISRWPADVLALADHLSVQHFSVLGKSAGGPFALACAAALPSSRLLGTGVIAGVAPTYKIGFSGMPLSLRLQTWLVTWLPLFLLIWLLDAEYGYAARSTSSSLNAKLRREWLSHDQHALDSEEQQMELEMYSRWIREAYRRGSRGIAREFKALVADWGFELREISCKASVSLWVGENDAVMPPAVVERTAATISGITRVEVFEGEDHESIVRSRGGAILQTLVELK